MPGGCSTARSNNTLAETGSYRVSMHAGESGRLIREYSLDDQAISADRFRQVELEARAKLASCSLTETILVITEEAPGTFRQVQVQLAQTGGHQAT